MLVGDPFIHHVINQDCINQISEHYLGPDFALFGAHYIAKTTQRSSVGWHQDGSYWPLKPMNVISEHTQIKKWMYDGNTWISKK